MSLTGEEREDAQRLWGEIGKPEAAQPTPEQLLAFMQMCDEPVGLDLAARMLQSADHAHNCWIAGHDALLDEVRWLRAELAEARKTVDAVDAWLADGEGAAS